MRGEDLDSFATPRAYKSNSRFTKALRLAKADLAITPKSQRTPASEIPMDVIVEAQKADGAEVTCAICLDIISDSRVSLPCKHSFCKECIFEMVYHEVQESRAEAKLQKDSSGLSCPLCRCNLKRT